MRRENPAAPHTARRPRGLGLGSTPPEGYRRKHRRHGATNARARHDQLCRDTFDQVRRSRKELFADRGVDSTFEEVDTVLSPEHLAAEDVGRHTEDTGLHRVDCEPFQRLGNGV